MKNLSLLLCVAGLVSGCASGPAPQPAPYALTNFVVERPDADNVVVSYETNDGEHGRLSTALARGEALSQVCTDIVGPVIPTSGGSTSGNVQANTVCAGPSFQISLVPSQNSSAPASADTYLMEFSLTRLDGIATYEAAPGARSQMATVSSIRFNQMLHLPIGGSKNFNGIAPTSLASAN